MSAKFWHFCWVLFVMLIVIIKESNSDLSCSISSYYENSEYKDLLCSNEDSSSGEKMESICQYTNIYSLIIESKNTTTLDRSMLYGCNAINFEMIDGQLESIHPHAFEDFSEINSIYLSRNRIKNLKTKTFFVQLLRQTNTEYELSIKLDRNDIEFIEDGAFNSQIPLSRFNLDVSHNKLKDFNLSCLPKVLIKIPSLDLSHNEIDQINEHVFEDYLYIDTLDLSHNKFKIFKPEDINEIIVELVDLSFNEIKEISLEVSLYPVDIKTLDLSHNFIQDLSNLSNADIKDLLHLNLSYNNIESIPLNTISKLSSLVSLNMSNNRLENLQFGIFANMTHLNLLDVSNNRLISNDLHIIYGIKGLNYLYFHNNEVDQFNFEDLPTGVQEVSFYGNKLKITCKDLSKIVMKHGKNIRIVSGKNFDKEHVLGMSCNSSVVNFVKADQKSSEDLKLISVLQNLNSQNEDLAKILNENGKINYKQQLETINNNNLAFFAKVQDFFYQIRNNQFSVKSNENKPEELSRISSELLKSVKETDYVEDTLKSISIQFTLLLIVIFGTLVIVLWKRFNLVTWFYPKSLNQAEEDGQSLDNIENIAARLLIENRLQQI